jgi:hypothetical protein
MPELAQHVVVTLAALGAAGIVVRRVFGTFAPGKGSSSPCDKCASAAEHRQVSQRTEPTVQPMILVRRGTRDA